MNERIRQLAEQADIRRVRTANALVPSGFVYLHTEETLEKFAELMVRECAEIFGQEETSRYEVDGNWIAKTIKQYFGVKE